MIVPAAPLIATVNLLIFGKVRRGESSQAYEKARLEVEKLIKKQKTYLEAQAQITLNEIKKQQQNPNMPEHKQSKNA